MRSCFADTAWFLALLGPGDQYHNIATELAGSLNVRVVTTEFVVVEVVNALSALRLRPRVRAFIRSLQTDPHSSVVPLSSELLDRGLKLFLERRDKEWSLTDCISFLVMEENGMTEALTTDHHFEQAGFVALLRQ